MQFPTGSVVALSSAASTVFSIGMISLTWWGIHEPTPWRAGDVVVTLLALFGFACLGFVPWLATSPMRHEADESRVAIARRAFLAGVIAMWLSIVAAIVVA
ncbi:hypothetical protein PXJ20_27900 [Paraburkholderia sp. A1RI_3L]|uniref:hypothetical protein n=1 Tax=Paraburkholderia TaxID=1822464 RepID=UPI000B04521B|nr:hypothetical protein [Paraburkholderia kururiensis]